MSMLLNPWAAWQMDTWGVRTPMAGILNLDVLKGEKLIEKEKVVIKIFVAEQDGKCFVKLWLV